MKMFTKLALVSSMAISANAMAMQSMDDAALSAATGQDGINIGIGISKIEIEKVLIHDNGGLAPLAAIVTNTPNAGDTRPAAVGDAGFGGTATAGAIVIKSNGSGKTATKGIVIEAPVNAAGNGYDTSRKLSSGLLAELAIDTDAGTGTNGAFLNVAAKVSGLDIYIGEIGVSASSAVPAATATTIRRGNESTNYNKILSGLTLKTGKMDANIQLGAAPQGAMIMLNTTMSGGLTIENLGIVGAKAGATIGLDTSTTPATAINTTTDGQISIGSIKIANASGTDLDINAKVNVFGKSAANNGFLRITTGSGTTYGQTLKAGDSQDMYISSVRLGDATDAKSIGDVEIQGMTTYYNNGLGFSSTNANERAGAMITISGH